MFDLIELDQAEAALRRLASGDLPARAPEPAPADRLQRDVSRCPFHNGAMAPERIAA